MNEYFQGDDASRASASMMSFVCGAIVGAGIALLLAPAAGEETRRRIRHTARRLSDNARDTMSKGLDAVKDIGSDARAAFGSGREEYSRSMESSPQGSQGI